MAIRGDGRAFRVQNLKYFQVFKSNEQLSQLKFERENTGVKFSRDLGCIRKTNMK